MDDLPEPHDLSQQLLVLLYALDGVAQNPRYHPEGDALFHSLQVFSIARVRSGDPVLWAAALLHDVGKAHPGPHDSVGAELLDGLVSRRVVWLVRNHLCLMKTPARARRRLAARRDLLDDLELLRRCDEAGRRPSARVPDPRDALASLFADPRPFLPAEGETPDDLLDTEAPLLS